MAEPDLELRAVIRRAIEDSSASLNVKRLLTLQPQFSPTAIKLKKVTTANAHTQVCIRSILQQAPENNLDLRTVKDVCQVIRFFWDNLADDFDTPPENLLEKDRKIFENFQKLLTKTVKRVEESHELYVFSKRTEIGDQMTVDRLMVSLVYLLEGLVRPAAALYQQGIPTHVHNLSQLEEITKKTAGLSVGPLCELEKRLHKTSDAKELILKLMNIFKCAITVLKHHPTYELPQIRARAAATPKTECDTQVEALNKAIKEIQERLTAFQSDDVRRTWNVQSYGMGAGSDEMAVKELKSLCSEMKENLYDKMLMLVNDGVPPDVDLTVKCVAHYKLLIGNSQLQLFQRLRPMNEPCFGPRLLLPTADITEIGEWRIKNSFAFWCSICDGEITWDQVDERPALVDSELAWKWKGRPKYMQVHEHYAAAHHLPALDQRGFMSKGGRWRGKGEARLYCGYCCNENIGTPIDPRFVFSGVDTLYKHLHAMHDNEGKSTSCCEIL